MAKFTLDSIRDAAEKKYGSYDIELADGTEVRLLNPLRLERDKRKALMSIQDALDEDSEAEQEDVLKDAIELVAHDKKAAKALLAEVGDDLAILAEIFSGYTSESQVGEASASES